MKNFSDFLVAEKIITGQQLEQARLLCEESASSLAEIILSEGYANPYQLYSNLAKFEGLEFADLEKYPCNKDLLRDDLRDDYARLRAIAWKKEGDKVVIAVCNINDAVEKWADENFGDYKFAITSPFDINNSINKLFEQSNNADALERLWRLNPLLSARDLFRGAQSKIFLSLIFLLFAVALAYPAKAIAWFFLVLAVFYTTTLAFKTLLFAIGLLRGMNIDTQVIDLPNSKLPVYTILVPLYKEERVLNKLVTAIKNLDYPRSKLDVKLIVEADDDVTINAIKALKCERMFEMVKVPYSMPRTKPKACNYALRFARGEFVTIYDAEDVPDPLQLKKVLYEFCNAQDNLACVQAKLNYFNREENLLSRLFAIEYSTLFDFALFGLEAMNIPIPLGGTSNHFRIETLNELYAWDPYNVTEDADLGIRIAQKGWRCKMIDSTTLEECPIDLKAWIRQRSRWVKGHMQTYFVHMRKPLELWQKTGVIGFMGVQFFLGAPALIFLISPIMWSVWALFIFGVISPPDGVPLWFYDVIDFSMKVLIAGIFLQMMYAVAAVIRNKWRGMWLAVVMFPFYWILHSVASFKSLWQLIFRPYYWEKTSHGVTKVGV